MRRIYNSRTIGVLEQGSIINYCYARDYPESEIYGIIITPRCDISNSKVTTIHYLPIVGLTEWICTDFWYIFSARALGDLQGKVKNILAKYNLSNSIIEMFSIESLCDNLKDKLTQKGDFEDFKKLLIKIELYRTPCGKLSIQSKKELIKDMPKVSLAIFKELRENRFKEFYLLEKWNNEKDYVVVLMREIGSLDWGIASQFSRGAFGNVVSQDLKKTNSLASFDENSFFQTLATLKSPLIEHLIQHFFLNFGRIGIEDHNNKIETHFHDSFINS